MVIYKGIEDDGALKILILLLSELLYKLKVWNLWLNQWEDRFDQILKVWLKIKEMWRPKFGTKEL